MDVAIVIRVWARTERPKPRARGEATPPAFTIAELLVVLSVISMLMAISLPSLGAARERGRRAVCLANLRSFGQGITIYATENQDRLVPGDSPISWAVWGRPTDALEPVNAGVRDTRPVNLGHLLKTKILPIPTGKETVLFCPSTRFAYGFAPPGDLPQQWGAPGTACITYAYNEALDGFGCDVIGSGGTPLTHKNTINFVRADGSVHAFRVQPVFFEDGSGLEDLQEVMSRYSVCFPTSMIFQWLDNDAIDVPAARDFLGDPREWYAKNSVLTPRRPLRLADVGNKPLVCDTAGQPVLAPDLTSHG